MKTYTIIGGQYRRVIYGETDSLQTAKRIATSHLEYWDDWSHFHKPAIWATETLSDTGFPDGRSVCVAKWNTSARKWDIVGRHNGKRWVEIEDCIFI